VARRLNVWSKYGFAWVTGAFFLFSLAGHWLFGWWAYVADQQQLGQPILFSEYAVEMGRDMFENWQSEFLQLLWQVCGLAILLYVGSPQSKEEEERNDAKLDAILRAVEPEKAGQIIAELGRKYPKQ
jgi:hypothetical protein